MEIALKEETFAKETFAISRFLPESRKKLDPAKHSETFNSPKFILAKYSKISSSGKLILIQPIFSNSSESIKQFEEVIIPYLQKEQKRLITDPQRLDYYGRFQRTDDVRSTYDPQRQQYLSRQYSAKHDKILSTFGLNGQRTCEKLFEK